MTFERQCFKGETNSGFLDNSQDAARMSLNKPDVIESMYMNNKIHFTRVSQ